MPYIVCTPLFKGGLRFSKNRRKRKGETGNPYREVAFGRGQALLFISNV